MALNLKSNQALYIRQQLGWPALTVDASALAEALNAASWKWER